MGYRVGGERSFQPPGTLGAIQDLGVQSVRDDWECVWPNREREVRGPILAGLTWPPLQGARKTRSQTADYEVARRLEEVSARFSGVSHVRAGGRGGGAKAVGWTPAARARGEGVGRAATSRPTLLWSSFRPRPGGSSSASGSASFSSPALPPPSRSSLPPPPFPQ